MMRYKKQSSANKRGVALTLDGRTCIHYSDIEFTCFTFTLLCSANESRLSKFITPQNSVFFREVRNKLVCKLPAAGNMTMLAEVGRIFSGLFKRLKDVVKLRYG